MKKLYFSLVAILVFMVANAQIVNIPDANFKAKLLSATPNNQIASAQEPDIDNHFSTYNTIDTNGDGEIQVSEASVIKYLNVNSSNINSLDGISAFTGLRNLSCSYNQLTSLNVSGSTNLNFLFCNNNQLSSLNVNGLTNLNRLYCYRNQLLSLNVIGLTNLQDLDCNSNHFTSLNVNGLTNLYSLICFSNLLTSLELNNLPSLQFLYCYGNYLTNLDVSGFANLRMFNCSHNQITSLNLGSLTDLQHLYCNDNQIPSLDLSGMTNLQILHCHNNQLTSLNIKNGNSSNWSQLSFISGNPSLAYVCADDEDTLARDAVINSGFSSTCNINSYCSFTPGGNFFTIQGNNKFDENNNGCDAIDLSIPNLKLNISGGTYGSLISNNSGNYYIPVKTGNYTITPQIENPSYFTVSPISANVTFPATTSPFTQNFCIIPNGVHHDLEVVIVPLGIARPGFDAIYKIKYKNKGNLNENLTINFNYNDSILDFVSSSVVPNSQAIGTRSWNIGTIPPLQSGEILVTLNLNSPTETPPINAGNHLVYTATATGLNTDETPVDNIFSLNQIVVNSYDPNDKTCLEGTTISTSLIGKYVHYKIRFENTGTYPAQNIVVKDMIEWYFDISTLQITDSSHNCTTKISNTNKVEFIFENINLPFDDANNDGYVVFKIKTSPYLTVGETIRNSANIYFDYNFPIVTNTATSTFQTLANNDFYLDKNVSLSPIPTKDNLTISLQNSEKINSVSIYNMLGQVVQTIIGSSNTINVSELKTGDYIIKITTENGSINKKFIKE